MGLQGRERTAEAGSRIPHSLTIEELICTAFVSIPWPLIKRLDYKKKASSFYAEPPLSTLFFLYHLAALGFFTCCYLGLLERIQHKLSFPFLFCRWLASVQCHIYTGAFSICGSPFLQHLQRGVESESRKLPLAGLLFGDV